MSEERNKDEEERLKKELKEWIDHRIADNNAFISSPKKETLHILIAMLSFLTVCSLWILGILKQYYAISIYLMFVIWLLSGIESIKKGAKEIKQEGMIKLIRINLEKIKVVISWYFKWAKPMFYSLWSLFLLSIPVLWIIGERRWWMWAPAILFVIFLPLIAEKGSTSFTALLDQSGYIKEKHKEVSTTRTIAAIISILILAIIGIYSCYNILKELIFVILRTPHSLPHIILTVILILVGFASLSEYLSIKFITADVSKQNYALSMLKTEIDRIEDAEALEKKKKELLKWYFPTADSFLVFFTYYGLMPTKYTFEVDEKDEKSNRN